MADTVDRPTPAYVSYSTFKNKVRALAPNGKLPSRIDRSALDGMSGAGQSQFLGALRFLGLIDENGVPSGRLTKLAKALEKLKAEWDAEDERISA